MSEKYKTEQPFKQYSLKNCPIRQLCHFSSSCNGAENILGSHFVKVFSALPSHLLFCLQYYISTVTSVLISIQETGANQLEPGQESMGDVPVLSHFLC